MMKTLKDMVDGQVFEITTAGTTVKTRFYKRNGHFFQMGTKIPMKRIVEAALTVGLLWVMEN